MCNVPNSQKATITDASARLSMSLSLEANKAHDDDGEPGMGRTGRSPLEEGDRFIFACLILYSFET